jgi:MFS family permease
VIAFLPLSFYLRLTAFFSTSFSPNLRYILLGILSATYPIAQVIAAPLLGHLSDKLEGEASFFILTSEIPSDIFFAG